MRIADFGMWNGNKKNKTCEALNAPLRKMERSYLKEKRKNFALQTIKLVESLPRGRAADVIGRQLLDAGTSVGANYRAACRARSPADFISKMGIVEEEADETIYWMELLIEAKLLRESDLSSLLEEANQILAMTVSSIKTARRKTTK